ncbi:MAG: hypothetical protein M0R28_15000 [Pigmentiphaga sp.]|nr:hypothetical protein [Pigmentiphaga sp.]
MRRRIEGVVPWLEGFDQWFGPGWWLEGSANLLLHPWPLPGLPGEPSGPLAWPEASRQGLARLAPYWQRFDVCLLPVVPATLAWTRMALATAADMGLPPVVVLANGLSAGAVADLMHLEVADFVAHTAGVDECWVRTARRLATRRRARAAATGPAPQGREAAEPVITGTVEYLPPASTEADPGAIVTQWMGRGVRALLDPERASRDFRETRGHVVAEFEREYVTTMLYQYGGNVSQASRAGRITRRTFWRLMRKFDIDSATYRQAAPLRQIRRWRTLPLKSEASPH